MAATQHVAHFLIYVNGTLLDKMTFDYQGQQMNFMDEVLSVEVDDSLYLPDMFTIHLRDRGLEILKRDVFKPGTKVKISVKNMAPATIEDPPPQPEVVLMIGEVTAIEPDLNADHRATLVVRGYDKSHRMHRERKTKTFQQVSDSDLATQLAGAAALTPNVQGSNVVYPYIMQANQTDWEFLMERARRINYRLYVEDNTLNFKPAPKAPTPTALEWGIDLHVFRARLNTLHQVSEVTVRGWDPKKKEAITETVSSAAKAHQIGDGTTGGQMSSTAFGVGGKAVILDQPVYTSSEARTMAQAMLDKINESYIEAEGECGGNPGLMAGSGIKVDGVGPRFKGTYRITRAVHYWTNTGYVTRFWCTGGTGANTLTELLHGNGNGAASAAPGGSNKWTARGVLVGTVTNNQDAENLGRVKVKFPVLGDNIESYWCRMASTMAGATRGIAFLPEAGDEVVVAFATGAPNHGYVLGAVWNGSDKLPKPLSKLVTGSQTKWRVIRSRVGHEILIDDTSEPGGFVIIDKTLDNKIVINTTENKIQIIAKSDIEITSTTGKVKITGQQGVEIKGDPGAVLVQSTSGNVDVKADAAKVTASGQTGVDATASAGKATLSGTMGVDVTAGGGKVSIIGTMGVDITGAPAPVNIKGLPVNLN